MADSVQTHITELLAGAARGDDAAEDRLWQAVYAELRAMAGKQMAAESPGRTLQPTALVHEAYLRLTAGKQVAWQDRAHFFRVAARTIRRILVNHALAKRADKRGGDWQKIPLDEITSELPVGPFDLVDVDELLRDLEKIDPDKARIVELRFFAGRTIAETATLLDTSEATVERGWRFARAWLRARLDEM